MLGNTKIGTRMLLTIGSIVALAIGIAAAGLWGLRTTSGLAEKIVTDDLQVIDGTADISVQVLELRRYEKDMILNFNNPETRDSYHEKWQNTIQDLAERITAVET